MPYSERATHKPMIEHIRSLDWGDALTVLDCGIGAGWMAHCVLAAADGRRAQITGLEIYLPYIVSKTLNESAHGSYNSIIAGELGDIEYFFKWSNWTFDVIIFGDSLEHLEERAALETLRRAKECATKAVYVNAPIINYPQGPRMGNQAEAHLFHYKKEDWEKQGLRYLGGDARVGAFVWEVCA